MIRDDDWEWKDRDDVAEQIAIGRLTPSGPTPSGAEAERVAAAALHRGEHWWLPRWHRWNP